MNEWWLHLGLPAGWGAAFLIVAAAVRAASPAHRRISVAEAAMAIVIAAPFGLGAGLLALGLRGTSYDPEFASRTGLGLVLLVASSLGLVWVWRRARNADRPRPRLTWRSPARLIVGLAATVLITSVAVGASSLITVPLMFWLIAGAHIATAVALTLIAGLTVYLATFIALYWGSDGLMIPPRGWVIPTATTFGAVALFVIRYLSARYPASAPRTADRP